MMETDGQQEGGEEWVAIGAIISSVLAVAAVAVLSKHGRSGRRCCCGWSMGRGECCVRSEAWLGGGGRV
jgi:hypothetical protein